MNTAGIIFSNLNENKLSRLTADRTLAAVPFACRYRLIDFALSNMVNAGISSISVITNYNYRSLLDHIGSGKDWDLARRRGGISLLSPFQTATPQQHPEVYRTHLEALASIRSSIEEMKEELLVLSDCEYIANIDLTYYIERHRGSGADMTILTFPAGQVPVGGRPRLFVSSNDEGRVERASVSVMPPKGYPSLSIDCFIVNRLFLLSLLGEAERKKYSSLSRDILAKDPHRYSIRTDIYEGQIASVGSFEDYFTESIRLTRDKGFREALLSNPRLPILTKVHNSSPILYRGESCVRESMIADDCVIEGTVENSVLFRGVKIGRGSVVRNCVLFAGTVIGEGSMLNCLLADKSVRIGNGRTLSGHSTMPMYIEKGRKV